MVTMSEIKAEAIAREDYNDIPPQKLISISDSLSEALFLYEKRFNLFPVEYGKKETYKKWGVLKHARLPKERIPELFEGQNNIAVITGKSSNNLFVLDCDDQDTFKKYLELLESKDLAKWVVITSRGGHIWFLSQEGEIDSGKLEGHAEVWGNNHYVISPPSLNKEAGIIYAWQNREGDFPPRLSFEEIREIFPKLQINRKLQGCFSYLVNEILLNKNKMDYETNSEAENAGVCSLIRLGWDDKSIIELFEYYSPPHYSSEKHPKEWLKTYMLKPARELIQVAPYIDKVKNSILWADSRTWNPRTGSTDKQVFLACCKRAMIEGMNSFRATEREIGELANITRQTARNSLRRLVQDNILEITPDKLTGTHYKIKEEAQDYPNKATVIYIIGLMSSPLITHDAWHPKALGKTSYNVYQYLLENNEKNVQEISSAIQKSVDTVERALDKLGKYRLAFEKEDVWSARPANKRYFDYIAKKLGTLGIAEKRKQQYQAERERKAYYTFMKN